MHTPVLLDDVLKVLEPKNGQVIVDATFGRGGYSRALLEAGAQVIGLDRDPTAQPYAAALLNEFEQFTFHATDFAHLNKYINKADGVVFDLGVSSPQLDVAERGFSFRFDGPLDMRMDTTSGITAEEVINTFEYKELVRIFKQLGEEKFANLIAKHIVEKRPFTSTIQLAQLIKDIIPKKVSMANKIHPATKVFQALRMYVNDELGQLEAGLTAAQEVLTTGGVLAVVSFHSLEDRLVKRFLTPPANPSRYAPQSLEKPTWQPLTRKPVIANATELEKNPRARSAKLRAARKLI